MTIGQAIKAARKATGLKQTELAEYLGVSVSSIRKWEQGRVRPTAGAIESLCQLLKNSEKLVVSLTADNMVKTIAESYTNTHG
jgi:transcriptional regulator with XRE-family HTH domain